MLPSIVCIRFILLTDNNNRVAGMKNKSVAIGLSLTRTPREGKGEEEKKGKTQINGKWPAETKKTLIKVHLYPNIRRPRLHQSLARAVFME